MSGSADIVAACEANWQAHKADCSGFAKAVATALGVPLTGMANDIVDQLQQSPWQTTTDGVAAAQQATDGLFVIAGLKDDPHGHVCVVTPGPLAHDKYPTAYWGRLGGVGMQNSTINWAWNTVDRDKVLYGYTALPEDIASDPAA